MTHIAAGSRAPCSAKPREGRGIRSVRSRRGLPSVPLQPGAWESPLLFFSLQTSPCQRKEAWQKARAGSSRFSRGKLGSGGFRSSVQAAQPSPLPRGLPLAACGVRPLFPGSWEKQLCLLPAGTPAHRRRAGRRLGCDSLGGRISKPPRDLQTYPGAQRGSTGSGAKPRSVIFPK